MSGRSGSMAPGEFEAVPKVNHIVMIAFDLLISSEIHTAIGLSSPLFSLFFGPSYATPPPRLHAPRLPFSFLLLYRTD